jgi:hypothetical protein
MHAQFGHRSIDGLPVAEVALLDRHDPSEDSRAGAAVAQPFDPPSEVLGLEDFDHRQSVSVWIHGVKTPRTDGADGALRTPQTRTRGFGRGEEARERTLNPAVRQFRARPLLEWPPEPSSTCTSSSIPARRSG